LHADPPQLRATFFVIGGSLAAHPQLWDIVAAGHELGNHSWRHSRLQPFFAVCDQEREIGRVDLQNANVGAQKGAPMDEISLAGDRSLGPVSGLLQRPEAAFALYVMAHGAGADMRHVFMQAMADALEAVGVATLRFNFPYTERRRRAPDPQPVLQAYVRSVCADARRLAPELALFAGGKSLGGRVTSNAFAHEPIAGVRGLVFLGFPLHAAKQPGRSRAEHLRAVTAPMLFLQGTRDDLSDLALLREVCADLGARATLREIDGANHSFALKKSSGRSDDEVRKALAAITADWLRPLT